MNTEPAVSEEDILHSMNFENVFQRAAALKVHRARIARRIKTAGFVAGILVLAVVGYYRLKPEVASPAKDNVVPKPVQEKQTNAAPAERNPESLKVPDQVNKQTDASAAVTRAKMLQPTNNSGTATPYTPAEPLNGFPDLYNYFNDELRYPTEALQDSIQGVVAVKFVINEAGKPEQFTLLNPLHPACDEEALRVMAKMPAWKPATLDGKPVSSNITIPLTFSFKVTRK